MILKRHCELTLPNYRFPLAESYYQNSAEEN